MSDSVFYNLQSYPQKTMVIIKSSLQRNLLYLLKRNVKTLFRMPQSALERVKQNTEIAKQTIEKLKNDLNVISETYNAMLAQQLREENAKLVVAVEEAKKKLVQLEVNNGVKQIPVPKQGQKQAEAVSVEEQVSVVGPVKKQPKERKEKEKKEKEASFDDPVDVGRLDLRIGKVVEAKRHPDADSLYVLQIECGEEKPRTVCSGLVKHVPIEELQDRLVVLLCNLKPVKMRGITSEAMVMCASSENGVEVLSPPTDSMPGERVRCNGYENVPDKPFMNPKKKIFEAIAPDLHTNDQLQACYRESPFEVPGKGYCVAKSLKNVSVK